MDSRKSRSSKKARTRPPERRLTPKQQGFITAYADPRRATFGNGAGAAAAAGYKGQPGSAQHRVQAHRNLQVPAIKQTIESLLLAHGCTPDLAVERLREGLDAYHIRAFPMKSGKVVYSEAIPDFPERRRVSLQILDLFQLTHSSDKRSPSTSSALQPSAAPPEPPADVAEMLADFEQLDPLDRGLVREALETDQTTAGTNLQEMNSSPANVRVQDDEQK